MSTRAVAGKVERARRALEQAEAELDDVRRRRRILCSCGKRHAVGKLKLLVTHWYVRPHGCTEGDYWKEGEWQFVCPVEGTRNRLMFDDYGVDWEKRDRVDVAAEPTFKSIYRGLFASRCDVYDDEGGHNNYYVDQHREQFELPPKPEKKS